MKRVNRPVFTHDCKDCRYLGSARAPQGTSLDLYFCPREGGLISRHGDLPQNYRFMGAVVLGSLPLSLLPSWVFVAIGLAGAAGIAVTPTEAGGLRLHP